MYNIRCDPELRVCKAAVRRISCTCLFCIEQLNLSWDNNEKVTNQKRYSMNKKFLNWNTFEGLNGWNIITLATQTKKKLKKMMIYLKQFLEK